VKEEVRLFGSRHEPPRSKFALTSCLFQSGHSLLISNLRGLAFAQLPSPAFIAYPRALDAPLVTLVLTVCAPQLTVSKFKIHDALTDERVLALPV
jgi:hypothetical protein